jgi:tetratricopeptide (TPR) repeat protein
MSGENWHLSWFPVREQRRLGICSVKRCWLKLFLLFWIVSRFAFAAGEAPDQIQDEGAISEGTFEQAVGCLGDSVKSTAARFSEVAASDEASVLPWLAQAVADESQGQLEDAISDCKEVVRLEPHNVLSWLNLARLLKETGQYEGAVDAYSKILEFEPGNLEARFLRAGLYERQGAYDKATADVSDVIRWHPDCAVGYSIRARLYNIAGDYDKAIGDADRAIQMNPRDLDAHLQRGLGYLHVKKYDQAVQDLTEGLKLTPTDGIARLHRAVAFKNLGKYKEALADMLQATEGELDGKSAVVFNSLAWMLATCPDSAVRNGEKATEYISRALQLDPNRWQLWGTRAAVFAENGDFGNAVKWEERCLEQKDLSEVERGGVKERLDLYRAEKPYREQPK